MAGEGVVATVSAGEVDEMEERWRKERRREWVEGDVLKACPGQSRRAVTGAVLGACEPEHSRSIHQHCAFAVH